MTTAGGGRALRIAHLTTSDISLAILLRCELEHDVAQGLEVIGLSSAGPHVPTVESFGVRHVAVDGLTRAAAPGHDLRATVSLWRTIRALDLDVLHTHNPKTGVLGRILGRLAGVPVVVNTCHGLWIRPGDPWPKRALVIGAEAFAAQFSHLELYQNDEDRARMRRFVPSRRARTVGNGIDLARFRPDPEARARLRAELGVGPDDVLVGGVGRLVREKGIEEYVMAAAALGDRATFTWVGPADDAGRDGYVVPDEHAVRFLGFREDMPAYYAALDVFVLPSYREGFSRSAMEAAASGCALLLTDIRGCREVGEPDVHARFVPPEDAGALTTALRDLLDDPAARDRLAGAALQRAAEQFDQRTIAQLAIDAYEDLLHASGRRGSADGRIRVLWVTKGLGLGGTELLLRLMAEMIDHDRFDVEVAYVLPYKDDLVADIEKAGVTVHCLGAGGGRFGWPRRLAALVRRGQFDIVHTHSPVAAALVRVLPGRPRLVHTEHNAWPRYHWASRAVNALTIGRNDAVLAVSEGVRDSMQSQSAWVRGPRAVQVLYHGVDDRRVVRGDDARSEARRRLGVDADVPVVGTVGSLSRKKDQATLLRAIARLRGRDVLLFVVGRGPLDAELKALSVDLGIQRQVTFLGRRTDVQELLPGFDVFALPSRYEGLGLALVEAMKAGIPSVGSEIVGITEVITDEVDGLLVPAGDAEALARAIERLLDDPELRDRFGEAAARGAERFSLPRAVDRLERLYEELA